MENVAVQTKAHVYDLLNAGPLHRFTVQGRLVHNCVVIDYADNLGPPVGVKDPREAIRQTWGELRGLALRLHGCVVAAAQSDAAGYDAVTLKRKNFSEARFKNDFVTTMININQTDGEKRLGLYRVNKSKDREEYFSEGVCCHVASCLAEGAPVVLSCM